MRSIAVYSLKGGVGKTTLAVNLAWAAVAASARRTLLWDLDPQAAASFLLGSAEPAPQDAQSVFAREIAPARLIAPTATERLDLLPADASLRGLDRFFFGLSKKRRLAKLLDGIGTGYDQIILDCPPGLTETSEQVMRAADLILVPVIPSPLSLRALEEVVGHLDRHGLRRGALLPVYNMADRRRSVHRATLEANPDWPVIPMASVIEAMSVRREPIGSFSPRSPAAASFAALWSGIERRLAREP